jgi:hypothetical protein
MVADWSAECSAEDPVLVVPWKDPNGDAAFIDLRANPYDLHHISEAEQHQPLMQALRALNASRSPVFTAKCDAWPLTEDEIENLRDQLDIAPDEPSDGFASGFASYIDLIWRERSLFLSFHQQEQVLRRLTRQAGALEHPNAALDCVLRPALVDLDGPQEGYAVSFYIKALGSDAHAAWEEWAAALTATVALLRSKDLFR